MHIRIVYGIDVFGKVPSFTPAHIPFSYNIRMVYGWDLRRDLLWTKSDFTKINEKVKNFSNK